MSHRSPYRITRWSIAGLLLSSAASLAWSADRRVPDDYTTIQAAIDASVNGDRVLVSAGTYPERLDFRGLRVEVIAIDGPAVTIVDGGFLGGPTVQFVSGEDPDSILEGFTITGGTSLGFVGFGHSGSGVEIIGASPTLRGNTIVGNSALGLGGGVYSEGGSPILEDNIVSGNLVYCLLLDAPCGSGAGLAFVGGSPQVVGGQILANAAGNQGGGVYVGGAATIELRDLEVSGNEAGFGGGVFIGDGVTAAVENLLVTDNSAIGGSSLGGYIPAYGGGFYVQDGTQVQVRRATVADNSALGFGGEGFGGAIWVDAMSTGLHDSILWNNQAPVDPEAGIGPGGAVDAGYCLVSGGGLTGPGVIDADPRFVTDGTGGYFLAHVATGQPDDSPAVDAGDPAQPLPTGSTRIDGVSDTGTPDLGYHRRTGGFRRGDANGDSAVDIADAIATLAALFVIGAPPPPCDDAADANDDGTVDIADAVALLASLFVPGTPPLPAPTNCGDDPTVDALECSLYTGCL